MLAGGSILDGGGGLIAPPRREELRPIASVDVGKLDAVGVLEFEDAERAFFGGESLRLEEDDDKGGDQKNDREEEQTREDIGSGAAGSLGARELHAHLAHDSVPSRVNGLRRGVIREKWSAGEGGAVGGMSASGVVS